MNHPDVVADWVSHALRILKAERRTLSVGFICQRLAAEMPRGALQELDKRGAYVRHAEWAIFLSLRSWYPEGTFQRGSRGRAKKTREACVWNTNPEWRKKRRRTK